jgi:NAD(P)-dependent dehydrogenase (short-subunit alcohol dehydrogenase family)
MSRAGASRPWLSVPPQDGRRFVITGASSGIGLATAQILVSRGAHVTLAVRSLEKGEIAKRAVEGREWRGRVDVRRLDVSSLSSVRSFAADTGPIDVLVNNAGVMGVPYATSAEGHELHLATNHLGHFALTEALLDRIADRIVTVSSMSHHAAGAADLDLDDLHWRRRGYRAYGAYATSKLANLLVTLELQRRLTASGSTLRAQAAHPGYASTGIQSHTGNAWFNRLGTLGNALVGMPAWQGALPTVYAATMDLPGNSYVGPGGLRGLFGWPVLVGRSAAASDPDLAAALWERSESLISQSG